MGSEWVNFGSCAELIRESVHPEDIASETPYIGLEHIGQGTLRLEGYGKASDVNSNKYIFRKGDILFGKLRPYFRKVIIAPFDGVCSTDIWVVRAKENIHQRYLFYWMASKEFVDFANQGSEGTKMPRAKWEHVSRFQRILPDLEEQKRIAHILGALDDKIELNQRMNETLEAMARALFKAWFVNFEPVKAKMNGKPYPLPDEIMSLFPDELVESELGPIPKGWRFGKLGEIVNVIDCLHSKKPERKDSGKTLLQLWNILDNGLLDMSNTYFISEKDYKKWISRIEASSGDCVITNVGRVGAVAQIPEDFHAALGRNMTAVRCKFDFKFPTFLIETLLSDAMREEILRNSDAGTILDALNVKNIPNLSFNLPPLNLINLFELKVKPLRRQMEINQSQNLKIAVIRNSILNNIYKILIQISERTKTYVVE